MKYVYFGWVCTRQSSTSPDAAAHMQRALLVALLVAQTVAQRARINYTSEILETSTPTSRSVQTPLPRRSKVTTTFALTRTVSDIGDAEKTAIEKALVTNLDSVDAGVVTANAVSGNVTASVLVTAKPSPSPPIATLVPAVDCSGCLCNGGCSYSPPTPSPRHRPGLSNVSAICDMMVMSILRQCGPHDTVLVNLLDGHYARHVGPWSSMIASSKVSFASPFMVAMDTHATASARAARVPHLDVTGLALHADVQTGRKTLTRFLPAGLGAWRFMAVSAALKARKRVIMTEMDVLYDPRAAFGAILSSKADYTGMISGSPRVYNAGFFMTQGPRAEVFFWCLLKRWLDKPSDVLAEEQMFMNAHIRRLKGHGQCNPVKHIALDVHAYSCCRRWHGNASGVEVAHITYCRRLAGPEGLGKEDRCKEDVLAAFYSAPFSLEELGHVGEAKQKGGLVPGC